MNINKVTKKIFHFLTKNYFITIVAVSVGFVLMISALRLFASKPTYIYAKLKVGQGLWWASTQKPSLWFIKNIKKGDIQADLTGKPQAEIISVRHYPTSYPNQYETYLILKLKVGSNEKNNTYSFNRTTLGVGAPIDLEFPSAQFSGTIIDISEKPITDKYVERIVYLLKPLAYDWEYEGVNVGDKFSNGEETVIEILDKSATDHAATLTPSRYFIDEAFPQLRKDILVKTRLKGQMIDGKFVFGEDQVISLGKVPVLATDNFTFTDYMIFKVE